MPSKIVIRSLAFGSAFARKGMRAVPRLLSVQSYSPVTWVRVRVIGVRVLGVRVTGVRVTGVRVTGVRVIG